MAHDPGRDVGAVGPSDDGPASTPAVTSHLVYLDVDDEITSAASRIRATEADRIALVLPYGSRLATSRINFRLLAREATERGKRLDIIGADASARALAAAAGLPVHASVAAYESRGAGSTPSPVGDETSMGGVAGGAAAATIPLIPEAEQEIDDDAPTSVIPVPRRSSPRVPLVGPSRPPVAPRLAIVAALAIIAAIVVAGVVAVQVLPSATIVLHPRSAAVGPVLLTVQARTDVSQPDAATLVIPAQRFTFPLESSSTFPATGTKPVDTKATGNVTFTNYDTSSSNRIPAGSIVSTKGGIDFATLEDVVVPAAPIFFSSQASVGIQAVEAGPGGNVAAGEITQVPRTENKHLLDVTNEDPTGGGAHEDRTVVSAQDVASARSVLEADLQAQLQTALGAPPGVPSGVTLYPETATVGEATPSVDTTTLVGTEATQFDLGVTAEGSVLGADSSPIAQLITTPLQDRVDAGWKLADGSARFEIGDATVSGDVVSLPVTVSGTEVHAVDQAALLAQIRGLVLAQARSVLDDYGDVSISLWPDWMTTIPTKDDQIHLTIGEPRAGPSPTP